MASKLSDGISHESYFIDYRSSFNDLLDGFKRLRALCYNHMRTNDIKISVKDYKHHCNVSNGDEVIRFKCEPKNYDIPNTIVQQIRHVSDSFYRYLDIAYPGDFSDTYGRHEYHNNRAKKNEHKINEYCMFQRDNSNNNNIIDLCNSTILTIKQNYIDRENLDLVPPTYIDCYAPGLWSSEDYTTEYGIKLNQEILSCSEVFKTNTKNLHYDDPFQFGKNMMTNPKLKFRDGFIMEGKTTATLAEYMSKDSSETELCLELNWLWRRKNVLKQSMLSECQNEFLILLSYILKLYHKLMGCYGDKTVLLDRSILGHYAFNRSMDNMVSKQEAIQNASIFLVLFGGYEQEYSILFKKEAKWPIENTPDRLFEFNLYRSFEHITNHYVNYKMHFMEGLKTIFDIYDILEDQEDNERNEKHTYYEIPYKLF